MGKRFYFGNIETDISQATAIQAGEEGHIIIFNSSQLKNDRLITELKDKSIEYVELTFNQTDREGTQIAFNNLYSNYGKVDAFVFDFQIQSLNDLDLDQYSTLEQYTSGYAKSLYWQYEIIQKLLVGQDEADLIQLMCLPEEERIFNSLTYRAVSSLIEDMYYRFSDSREMEFVRTTRIEYNRAYLENIDSIEKAEYTPNDVAQVVLNTLMTNKRVHVEEIFIKPSKRKS
ncbi:MAG: hypothetical protein Kow00108_25310 [Calditrichia bacterium]